MEIGTYHGDTKTRRKTSKRNGELQFARWESVGWIVLLWFLERDCASSSFWPHSAWRWNKRKRILRGIGRRFRAKKPTDKPPGKAKGRQDCQDFEKGGHSKAPLRASVFLW
jgi:hypothetical protein